MIESMLGSMFFGFIFIGYVEGIGRIFGGRLEGFWVEGILGLGFLINYLGMILWVY